MKIIPNVRPATGACLVLALCALVPAAEGKSWSVETWGVDAADCGSRASPCRTPEFTLDQMRRNDRMVIGPGPYNASLLITDNDNGPLSGIKLYSVAGRYATILFSNGSAPVVSVGQPNVRVGARGKGFTLRPLGPGVSNRGVSSGASRADRIRIEGNNFLAATIGIAILGDRVQIRDNVFHGTGQRGISCANCPLGQIRNNQFHEAEDGAEADIYVNLSQGITIAENLFFRNDAVGIISQSSMARTVIRDNAFFLQRDAAAHLVNADGALVQGNITYGSPTAALNVTQISTERPASVRNNLTMSSFGAGIITSNLQGARLTGNTSIFDYDDGFRLNTGSQFSDLSKNNAIETTFGCGLRNATGNTIDAVKLYTFRGNGSALPHCNEGAGSITNVTPADRPSPVNVNRAAKL